MPSSASEGLYLAFIQVSGDLFERHSAILQTLKFRQHLSCEGCGQGLHRPCKVARLVQGELLRAELKDVTLVWASDGRMTLAGFEQIKNEAGQIVDYRQSWLVMLDSGPSYPELSKRKVSPN